MKQISKKMLTLLWAALTCASLSGCFFNSSVEDMFSLPRLPTEYMELEKRINGILSGGAEYAAPLSGSNIQPVQLVDLDGDGGEEALAFFRESAGEKPLKIYIFKADEEGYEQAAIIEGSGTSVYSIVYNDMDGDGEKELVVCWRVSTTIQVLSVYRLNSLQPEEMLRSSYAKYILTDLNSDGKQELVIIQADSEGNSVADYYRWRENALGVVNPANNTTMANSSTRISTSVAELTQATSNAGTAGSSAVYAGRLREEVPALFVTGVEDGSPAIAITDILVDRDGELSNIVLNAATGVSTEIYRFLSLHPKDIDGDGVTEVPAPVAIPSRRYGESQLSYRIDWRNYDAQGKPETVERTFHAVTDGWYLTLPKEWDNRIMITRDDSQEDEVCVAFSVVGDDENPPRDFLRIYTVTGDGREKRAIRNNRFILSRRLETIYCAELPEEGSDWSGRVTEEELRTIFHLILTEWSSADY